MNEINFSAIPTAACRLAGGEVNMGDNGDNAKSAPIRLKARSGDSIEHWYWGKVIHDLAGMRLHKPRLTVDYAHNDSEVLGYLNHFDSESGDLIASGALTPWREDDRASEVMFKMKQGVPYEASIFFGGDGIKIQEVMEGQVETVNGRTFEGPGVIIREWPLRGVAICPYGADSNTESVALANGETVAAQKWTAKNEVTEMKDESVPVEAEAKAEGEQPVEAMTVEAEGTHAPVAADEVEELKAKLTEASGSAAALAERVTALDADVAKLTAERDAAIANGDAIKVELAAAVAEKDAAVEARAEAERRLAAIVAGQQPVSAAPAEETESGSWMERARKNKKG